MATAEKRAKGWRGRYKDADRRTHDVRDASGKIRYFKSKRAAKQAALDKEAEIRQGTWFDPTVGAITLNEYFEKWLVAKAPTKALATGGGGRGGGGDYGSTYRGTNGDPHPPKEEFGDVELRAITPTAVEAWVAKMINAGSARATSGNARILADRSGSTGGGVGLQSPQQVLRHQGAGGAHSGSERG